MFRPRQGYSPEFSVVISQIWFAEKKRSIFPGFRIFHGLTSFSLVFFLLKPPELPPTHAQALSHGQTLLGPVAAYLVSTEGKD